MQSAESLSLLAKQFLAVGVRMNLKALLETRWHRCSLAHLAGTRHVQGEMKAYLEQPLCWYETSKA